MKKVVVELDEKQAHEVEVALDERGAYLDGSIRQKSEGEFKEILIGRLNDTQEAKKKITDAINKAKP